MCTKEEWDWYKEHLIEGVSYLQANRQRGIVNSKGKIDFNSPDWAIDWDIKYHGFIYYPLFSDFRWPDGSPMIPFVAYDGTPFNRVLFKIKSLENRFKTKSLPKTKMKTLPFPA